jgi:flavin reductase (DIM6/NTAB) family NADH-FMN oxidoreductase RutF
MMKLDVPLSIPEGLEFPEYKDKRQLGRWIWRHIQIPQLVYLITTRKRNGLSNCEVNSWGLPFGFVPNQMFAFYCDRFHHTGRNILRDGGFVVNVPGADIGDAAVRTARSYGDDVDEIAESGLTALPSSVVAPPRIEECKAHLECVLEWYKEVDESGAILFCGRVVAASGDRDILTGSTESKMGKMRPVFVMPTNIDTEKMALTALGGTYAGIGRVRRTAQE